MTLSHREQFRAALSGHLPDRPLVDLGGRVASISAPAYLSLKSYLGFGDNLVEETLTFLNTIGRFDERILEALDIPFRRIFLRQASTFTVTIADDGSFKDEWGVGYVPIGPHNERVGHPLANATLEDLESYPWPDPTDSGRVKGLAAEARQLHEETGYCIVAGHISAGIFQDCWNLRGMSNFLEDMALNPEFAGTLLQRVTDIHIGMWEGFLDAVGEYVDLVETADDLGGQNSLLISPKMYRQMVKPCHAALNAAIRNWTQARIFFHSCGAILPLIDDLLEIGVDILNPIQPLPGRMDPETLQQRYGGRLLFHGGLDVQNLLLTGTPEQIRQHVQRYLKVFGPQSYIMAPANTVLPGTPPENLIAAYQAAREFSGHSNGSYSN
jgi:uroporphyrinogen decarboxylase